MLKETLISPYSGIVAQVFAHSDDKVTEGQEILSIEIMKLLYFITAGLTGKLIINVVVGEFVQEGQELGTILEE